jgi:phage baseplate assembly protein gpV
MTKPSPARLARPAAGPARLRLTPGRWLTLVVGVPVLLALIGGSAFSLVAQIGEATFRFHDAIRVYHGQLTAHLDGGNVTLQQGPADRGPGDTAQLTGTATYSLVRATVKITGSNVTFRCPLPAGNCTLNAALRVPAQTAVSLFTDGGDATVPSFTASAPLTLNTDGGNLSADRLAGRLDLETGGGDLSVGVLNGAGLVPVNTGGGNLTIEAMTASQASISSGSGNVDLVFTKAPDDLRVNSDGGNVTLVLPRAQYDISANADGGNLSSAVRSYPRATKSITIDSGSGNITILQAG